MPRPRKPLFFATLDAWMHWLEENHARENELLVGLFKRGSGRPSITWPESVDGALCYGWIDGVRRALDEESYCIRFTPRKSLSTWSAVNIRRAAELAEAGRMHPAGARAYESRRESRSAIYAYEQGEVQLEPSQVLRFQADESAWSFFQAKPPWYRRTAIWWVVSAKRPETRESRLATLIADCAAGRTIKQLTRSDK